MRKLNIFRWFLCNVLDKHKPWDVIRYDGTDYVVKCKYCGRRITQDFKGNWF